ncbi:MAG: SAS049 family protein [Staphylococcus epidermidis]|nr:SAS049 family protein [Staphylococcus epidermidis]
MSFMDKAKEAAEKFKDSDNEQVNKVKDKINEYTGDFKRLNSYQQSFKLCW